MGLGEIEPRAVALHDQLGAHLAALAPTLGQFHSALLSEGFVEYDAITLTRDYFEWHLENAGTEAE